MNDIQEYCIEQLNEIINEHPDILNKETIENAQLFINCLPTDIEAPLLCPVEQWGGVDFAWYSIKGYTISITIDEECNLISAWLFGETSGCDSQKFNKINIPDNLLNMIRQIIAHRLENINGSTTE